MASVGGDELAVGVSKFLGGDHRLGATAKQLGPVGAQLRSQPVELRNEVIVELNEHFAAVAARHSSSSGHTTPIDAQEVPTYTTTPHSSR